jgi:hypothetical protein
MECGNAFLLYDDDDRTSIPHLHIAVTDSSADDCVVLVSVTTQRSRSDTMTRLTPGDHPFITAPSVITYAYTKLLVCSHIEAMIASGDITVKPDASERVVRRAQEGLRETDRAPQEVKEFFLAWLDQQNRG